MKKFLEHKKVKAMIIGLIVDTIVAILATYFKTEIGPELYESIMQLVVFFYGFLPTAMIGGQAYADGKSRGFTSSTPPQMTALETELIKAKITKLKGQSPK